MRTDYNLMPHQISLPDKPWSYVRLYASFVLLRELDDGSCKIRHLLLIIKMTDAYVAVVEID